MVPQESAVMDMPNEHRVALNADHFGITKFVDKMDPAYHLIFRKILSIPLSKPGTSVRFGKLNIRLDDRSLIFAATQETSKDRPAIVERM